MTKRNPSKANKGEAADPSPGAAFAQVTTQVPLVYADAVGSVIVSPVNTRLGFVVNIGLVREGSQQQTPALEVVIPTITLIDFVNKVQTLLTTQSPGLLKAYDEQRAHLAKFKEKDAP